MIDPEATRCETCNKEVRWDYLDTHMRLKHDVWPNNMSWYAKTTQGIIDSIMRLLGRNPE